VTEEELALGIHSKLLGQMRLVLLGRSLISEGGSFTLMSGYILDDPIPEATSFAVANGGVEGFVRAAALSLERRVRINAVSPGMAQDSYEQFGSFNPGRAPVPMLEIASAFQRSIEGWRTGEIIRAW
jgi:NAD(P)-dependent dehydrogenase (short-subunit alcohol dehydrogenase family)